MAICESCGFATGHRADCAQRTSGRPPRSSEPPSELRNLTVLFCDLVGSVHLSQTLDLEDFSQLVAQYHAACSAIVERCGGHVAQYLGDGILVYFGFPVAREDAAKHAVDAALRMVSACKELKIQVRIGIHSGLAVTGSVGAGSHRETLAVGLVPNVAARVQALAAPGAVVLSASTHRLVEGFFECTALGAHEVKGLSDPVEVFAVVARTGVESRFEASERRGLGPLRGRYRELDELTRTLSETVASPRKLVLISGEAGIGKSRLLHELENSTRALGRRWLVTRCSPSDASTAWAPLPQLLGRLLACAAPAFEDLERRANELGLASELASVLAPLAGIPVPPDRLPAAPNAAAQRAAAMQHLTELLQAEARRQSLVWCIEDIHWLDATTLEFLKALAGCSAGPGLAIFMTQRPGSERFPSEPVVRFALGPLDRTATAELVHDVCRESEVPPAVVAMLVERSDRVPLFVEELTRAVLESGTLVAAGRGLELNVPVAELSLPLTLFESVMVRLDRLGCGKKTAQLAAVLGREFSLEILRATGELVDAEWQRGIEELEAANLVTRRGSLVDGNCSFKHALVHDVAYRSLLKADRVRLHGSVAQLLLDAFPRLAEARPEQIAHHLELSRQYALALKYFRKAAERMIARAAYEEARDYVTRAEQLESRLTSERERREAELSLCMLRAQIATATKGYNSAESVQALSAALDASDLLGDSDIESTQTRLLASRLLCAKQLLGAASPEEDPARARLFWILWGFGAYHQASGELDRALAIAEQLLVLAGSRTILRLDGHFGAGSSHYYLGNFAAALEHLDAGLECYRAIEVLPTSPTGHHAEVLCAGYRELVLWHLGRDAEALRQCEETVAMAAATNHAYTLACAYTLGAWLHQMRGDIEATREFAQRGVDLGQAHGFGFLSTWCSLMKYWAESSLGTDRIDELRRTLAAHKANGNAMGHTYFLSLLAELLMRSEEYARAGGVLDEALDEAGRNGERLWEAELLRQKALVYLAQGAPSVAKATLERALAVARRQDARRLAARVSETLARLLPVPIAESPSRPSNRREGDIRAEDQLIPSLPT
jgi:class 3 adenylate cyclase/tetratricopeptide (TPR) repeat protein